MDLSALADFNLVALHGGFGRASRFSGRAKATLSRHVIDLENSLGVRLLERSARSFKLTDAGKALFERTSQPLGEIADVGNELVAGIAKPRGRLRVTTPVLFGHMAMGKIAAGFAAAYPEVRLDVVAEDRFVDLIDEEYDVAVRVNPRDQGDLVGRCFARDEILVVAPPDRQRPWRADDARMFEIAAVISPADRSGGRWELTTERGRITLLPQPYLRLSSMPMARDAVRGGAGPAALPRSMVAEDLAAGRLECWGAIESDVVELWVLHTSRRLVSAKVSAFVAFICAAFPDQRL